jgi:hypothetical protein
MGRLWRSLGAGTALVGALIGGDWVLRQVPEPLPAQAVNAVDPVAPPELGELQDALTGLGAETAALRAEIAALERAKREADAAAAKAAQVDAVTPVPPRVGPAPRTHARSGASGGSGEHESEGGGDD